MMWAKQTACMSGEKCDMTKHAILLYEKASAFEKCKTLEIPH